MEIDERIQMLARAELHGMRCIELLYPPNLTLPWHEHERLQVSACLSGSVVETSPDGDVEIGAGFTLVRPAHTMHSNLFGRQHLRALVIEIDDETIERFPVFAGLTESPRLVSNARLTSLSRRIVGELRHSHPASRMAIEGLALQLLSVLIREKAMEELKPEWLWEAVQWMRDHELESIGVKELSQRFGVHQAHFARMFKRAMHVTVAQFVRRLRIDRAAKLLGETDKGISQIGFDCGFSDQAHFTRAFTAVIGVSPGTYRRMVRDEMVTSGDEGR